MTGNDIVDMKAAAAESNWRRPGFMEKIFTQVEQQYIQGSPDPDRMVWRLWSMKESVYKVFVRSGNERSFAPLKFQCSIENDTKGTVCVSSRKYYTHTAITGDYVYSIAFPENKQGGSFSDHCFNIPPGELTVQQRYIHSKIIAQYASITGKKEEDMFICKNVANIPWLVCKDDHSMIPVSITHHGRYAAFTFNHRDGETIPFLVS